ncbi:MAG TPA: carbohydrate kinase family protein [Nitrosopumilaceae archaeon]|nr:carbohydrate kinase family protein [Nitrosopumilaceae archaeon]
MLEQLQNLNIVGSVVVLNDFFLDRIVKIQDISRLYELISKKSQLGGSIRGIPQTDLKGGNATNIAYALARLGAPVSLITVSDRTSSHILQDTFSEFQNATLFLSDGKPGRTVSLEFSNKGHVVNIMLSDIGDNENFGPEKLGQKEQSAIQNADAIIVANWASNERGTDLSKFVFEKSTKSLHFLDPADMQSRSGEFKEAVSDLASNLDSLCLNENECNILLKQFGLGGISGNDETKRLVSRLSEKASVAIDLHTSFGAFWSNGKEVEFVKSFPTEVKFVTGAGDVWDAANILGYLGGLEPKERLLFANAASSLYVGNSNGMPPTMQEVLSLATAGI